MPFGYNSIASADFSVSRLLTSWLVMGQFCRFNSRYYESCLNFSDRTASFERFFTLLNSVLLYHHNIIVYWFV